MTASRSVGRDAVTVTTWNLVSRITGFARVLVVGGALGATRLGDTYQASNQLSNLLFEFLAAGTLSAVLVPGLTSRLVSADPKRAADFASAVLGRLLLVLAGLALVGMVCARPLMELLLANNDAPTRSAQLRVGAFLLLFVMPQVVLYGWGAVITAVMNANGRFTSGAAAPVANNLFVIVAVGAVWVRDASGMGISRLDQVLLGAGALGGVVCMTLVPVVMAACAGLAIRPRLRSEEPLGMSVGSVGWATMVVLPAQVFFFVSLVVANEVSGGVVACQVAFTFFLLPHALLGHPLSTVLYPRLARAWATGDADALRADAGRGLRALALMTVPASVALVALAPWIVRVVAVGGLGGSSATGLVAAALGGYGVALTAYSWSLLVSRISYATDDVRTPGIAAILGALAGIAALAAASSAEGDAVIASIGLAHSTMAVVTVVVVLVVLVRRELVDVPAASLAVPLTAAIGAGVAARLFLDRLLVPDGRVGALLAVILGAALIAGCHVGALWLTGLRWADVRGEFA